MQSGFAVKSVPVTLLAGILVLIGFWILKKESAYHFAAYNDAAGFDL